MVKFKKDDSGNYYFTASLGFDKSTGKRIQKKRRGFKTIREAKEAYAELVANFGKNSETIQSTMLFEEYFYNLFLPYYKGKVEERTYNNRLSTIKKTFSYFFKMSISEIKPINVQRWQNQLLDKYKNSYVRNIFGIFQMSLDRAVVLGLIDKNPAKIIGNVRKRKDKVEFWTKEEFEKVVATFYIDDFYQNFAFICIWLLFMTGMRVGEATALLWQDVDFEKKELRVSKTLNYKNAKNYEFVEPKTHSSIRTIELDDDTIGFLWDWKMRQNSLGGMDFVLSYNSIPSQKHTIRHIIRRHADLAGVHAIRIHGLRHSHAALLISQKKDALRIMERLGHADVQTTLGTYGHLYPNSLREIANDLTGSVKVDFSKVNIAPETKNQFTTKRKRNNEGDCDQNVTSRK
jgi:integrase